MPPGQYLAYTFFRVQPDVAPAPGGGARGGQGRVRRGDRRVRAALRDAERLLDDGRAAGDRLLPLEDHAALRGPRRARRGAERDAARGLPRDAVLVPRDDEASQYTSARKARKIIPKGSPYLVVYPFVKVRPWYALPEETRQRAMDEHMRIGHEHASIHNYTTYSFGIDDQEFMTVFECDEPADFMHLMLTLRHTEASAYTERDTPIFVGQYDERPRRARPPRRRRRARRGVALTL